ANLNETVERTITVLNQGNGSIPVFNIDRALGNGLSHVEYDFTDAEDAGWTINQTDSDHLIFTSTDGGLTTGTTLTFTEKVMVNNCALTPTDYEVYYGCDSKCMASSVNGTVRHIINLAAVNAPQLNVTGTTNITCFNNFGRNTWTITNTGGETMTNIEFDITTSDPNGYL